MMVAEIIEKTLHETPSEATHWTVRDMAKAMGISISTVQKIWLAHGLAPHRIRQFKLSNDTAFVTHLCGFKAMKHEGKITGLAAQGVPRYVDVLRRFVDEQDGVFLNHGGVVFRQAIKAIGRELPSNWKREDMAASVQVHFEEAKRFRTLERAAMSLQNGKSWHLEESLPLRTLLREVRGAIGQPVPNPIELVSDKPPKWAR